MNNEYVYNLYISIFVQVSSVASTSYLVPQPLPGEEETRVRRRKGIKRRRRTYSNSTLGVTSLESGSRPSAIYRLDTMVLVRHDGKGQTRWYWLAKIVSVRQDSIGQTRWYRLDKMVQVRQDGIGQTRWYRLDKMVQVRQDCIGQTRWHRLDKMIQIRLDGIGQTR